MFKADGTFNSHGRTTLYQATQGKLAYPCGYSNGQIQGMNSAQVQDAKNQTIKHINACNQLVRHKFLYGSDGVAHYHAQLSSIEGRIRVINNDAAAQAAAAAAQAAQQRLAQNVTNLTQTVRTTNNQVTDLSQALQTSNNNNIQNLQSIQTLSNRVVNLATENQNLQQESNNLKQTITEQQTTMTQVILNLNRLAADHNSTVEANLELSEIITNLTNRLNNNNNNSNSNNNNTP